MKLLFQRVAVFVSGGSCSYKLGECGFEARSLFGYRCGSVDNVVSSLVLEGKS